MTGSDDVRWDGSEPWLAWPVDVEPSGEGRDTPFACVVMAVVDCGNALDLAPADLAGILGITKGQWLTLLQSLPDVAVDTRLEASLRLMCELFGSVLKFAGSVDGACWMRKQHPAMGDSPLGRLIRSPSALPWLSSVLFEERHQ